MIKGSDPFFSRSEGVLYPSKTGFIACLIQADDIESHSTIAVLRVAAQERGGCSDDFSLLVVIDRAGGRGVSIPVSKTDFSKDEAVAVHHDEIDLAHPAAKIPGYFIQAPRLEVIESQFLCLSA